MKICFFLLMLMFSLSSWANWHAEVALGIDGETWKIERETFQDGKEGTLDIGNYVLKMTLKKTKEPNEVDLKYTVHEKKGEKLTLINKGQDTLNEKKTNDIYAKGEPGQPHSIITIKFQNNKEKP